MAILVNFDFSSAVNSTPCTERFPRLTETFAVWMPRQMFAPIIPMQQAQKEALETVSLISRSKAPLPFFWIVEVAGQRQQQRPRRHCARVVAATICCQNFRCQRRCPVRNISAGSGRIAQLVEQRTENPKTLFLLSFSFFCNRYFPSYLQGFWRFQRLR
jgi:hypothetical protein